MSAPRVQTVRLPYAPRRAFLPFHKRTQRWACLVAHRRAGKTVAAVNDLIRAAITAQRPHAHYAYVAPYRSQAKSVAWDYLKRFAAPATAGVNEAELLLTTHTGAKIQLFGADNADAMRGLGFDGVYLDEYGDFRPSVWGNVIRPTLSDRAGWAVIGGTPRAATSSTRPSTPRSAAQTGSACACRPAFRASCRRPNCTRSARS